MKKHIVVSCLVICLGIAACGGGTGNNVKDTVNATTGNTSTDMIPSDVSSNPDYQKGLNLIAKNDCLTCHQISGNGTGPAYQDVANKYSDDEVTENALAQKIIHGGSGVWGTVPMTPHPDLSIGDAKAMVKYILMLKTK